MLRSATLRGRRALAVAVAGAIVLAAALGLASSARTATPSTTGVDPLINVSVRIEDGRLIVKPSRVARLETVAFRVVNTGKLTHDFHVGGLKTRPLKRGEVAHVLVQFADRGAFLYRCRLHCSVKMRGYISVYSPIG
jgi:plastocyanin